MEMNSAEERLVATTAYRRGFNLMLLQALLIFGSARTLHYWQGWLYWIITFIAGMGMTRDMVKNSPDLLRRRVHGGVSAEARPVQKVIMAFCALDFAAMLAVSALDHRWRWAHVPFAAVLAGNAMLVIGNYIVYRVFKANQYTASTVRVEEEQKLVDSGPYAVVRHPMYSGGILLLLCGPIALGSLYGLIPAALLCVAVVARLLDEERMLIRDLPGYSEYRQRTRYRLLPGVW